MQPDPLAGSLANPQSLNRYAYVVNDPINFIDPLGLTHNPDHVVITEQSELVTCYRTWLPIGAGEGLEGTIGEVCVFRFGFWEAEMDPEKLQRLLALLEKFSGVLKSAANAVKSVICSATPDAIQMGAVGTIGAVGSPTGSAQLVINFNTGEVSTSVSGGGTVGWNAVAQGMLFMAASYGVGESNDNLSGQITTIGGTAAVFGGFIARGNGVTTVGISAGGNLLASPTGGITKSVTSGQAPLGNVEGALASGVFGPVAQALFRLRQMCH